eukprot:1159560-Pelagomonas_calceolata.AAC.5
MLRALGAVALRASSSATTAQGSWLPAAAAGFRLFSSNPNSTSTSKVGGYTIIDHKYDAIVVGAACLNDRSALPDMLSLKFEHAGGAGLRAAVGLSELGLNAGEGAPECLAQRGKGFLARPSALALTNLLLPTYFNNVLPYSTPRLLCFFCAQHVSRNFSRHAHTPSRLRAVSMQR